MDQADIYREAAEKYDALVSAEDCDANLLPALQALGLKQQQRVVDVGTGTGRLARLIAPTGPRVIGIDLSPAMLTVARRRRDSDSTPHYHLCLGHALKLPVASGWADVSIAGWVFGHFTHWMPDGWRSSIRASVQEMWRVVRLGGTLFIIETLGTGVDSPMAPDQGLAMYYGWLEKHGFHLTWLRTDYKFRDAKMARQMMGFFFGKSTARLVQLRSWTRVPECTGIWWKNRTTRWDA